MVRVLFYRGSVGFYGSLIRLWTWGRYSHVGLLFSDKTLYHSQEPGGVQVYHRFEVPANCDLLQLNLTLYQEQRIRRYCEAHLGERYDWTAIFLANVFYLNADSRTRKTCSEYVAEALTVGQVVDIQRCVSESPNSLYRLLTNTRPAGPTASDLYPLLKVLALAVVVLLGLVLGFKHVYG